MATTIGIAGKGSTKAENNIAEETVENVKDPLYITPVGVKSLRPQRLRKRIIIGIMIGFGAVVAIAVPLAIMTLSKGESFDGAQRVDIGVTILNMQYSKALADNKSLQYSNFTEQFCKEIELRYLDSQLQDEYDGCFVNDVRNGSVKVIFTMAFSSKSLVTEMAIISVLTRRTKHLATDQDQIILGKYVLEKESILVRNKNPFTASLTANYRTTSSILGGSYVTTKLSETAKEKTTIESLAITSRKLSTSISTTTEPQPTTTASLTANYRTTPAILGGSSVTTKLSGTAKDKPIIEFLEITSRKLSTTTASLTAKYRTSAILGGSSVTTKLSGTAKVKTTIESLAITSRKRSTSILTTTESQPTTTEPLTIEQKCENGATLIPYPYECQLYYNCSKKGEYDIYRRMPGNMQECLYPQFFNTETLQCDGFENVDCGTRNETKDGCGYWLNKCAIGHCIPCSVRFPSCVGQSNGSHAYMEAPWSPSYITCYKERFVSKESCPDVDGFAMFFHMDREECIPHYMIPQEHGGTMTNCTGKSDGNYSDEFGRCNLYAVCEGGQTVEVVKCEKGTVFDEDTKKCLFTEEACGSCLEKPCT